MKNYFRILSIACLLFSAGAWHTAAAQCSEKFIRQQVKNVLPDYVFETASSRPFSQFKEPRKVIKANFTVYENDQYRVLNLCHGFGQKVTFIILDPDNKEIFNNQGDSNNNLCDFKATKSGDYIIQFKFEEQANPDACVAFAIGYKL